MYIAIQEILIQQNRTIYWLAKQTGCNYYALSKLCRNETSAINFVTMESICNALNCKPNDIFIIEE